MTEQYKKINISKVNHNWRSKNSRGFTLVEIMVAMSVFIIIMVISTGAILSIFNSNQKSKTQRSAMDNLSIALEGMTRNIRFGTKYHCNTIGDVTQPLDCPGGIVNTLYFRSVDGNLVKYSLVTINGVGRIARSINGGVDYYITSSDINITSLVFFVRGSASYSNGTDLNQPQVIVFISGTVGVKANTLSTFYLQTTISQRKFDFQ